MAGAIGQSWTCADIPMCTMATSPDHTHSHTRVPAGEFWFLTGGCCGGNLYTAAANLAKDLWRLEPGILLNLVVVSKIVCVTVGRGAAACHSCCMAAALTHRVFPS